MLKAEFLTCPIYDRPTKHPGRALTDTAASFASRFPAKLRAGTLASPVALPLAMLILAMIGRSASTTCADVSWLLTVGERVLAGARPYVDIIETNPPASFLIYMPAIVIGRIVGLAPEIAVTVLVFIAALGSVALAQRILAEGRLRHPASEPLLLAAALFLLLIMPAYVFGQREHIAAIAVLPMLAAYGARAQRVGVAAGLAVLAGLGAGVAIALKPHFALPVLLPLPYVAMRLRGKAKGWIAAALTIEMLTAGLVVASYLASILLFFPAFVSDTLPEVAAVYLSAKMSLPQFATNPTLLLSAAILLTLRLTGRDSLGEPATAVLMLAAAGFLAAMLIQFKGWPYHGYPVIALGLMACARLVAQRLVPSTTDPKQGTPIGASSRLVVAAVAAFTIACLATSYFADDDQIPGLATMVARLAPPHPKVIALSGGVGLGHPLTRRVSGEWAARQGSQWILASVGPLLDDANLDPGRRARILAYERSARDMLAEDISHNRPDVVLVQNDAWRAWIASHAEIKAVLNGYREAAKVSGVSILLRGGTGRS
ncbi:MAG: hypothetical protein JO273_15085 [Methylobacteriaceae bacterium]|nr:hypothetical protein [Methylobacteriaceae bacterium]